MGFGWHPIYEMGNKNSCLKPPTRILLEMFGKLWFIQMNDEHTSDIFWGVVYSISSVLSSSICMSMSWYDHQNLIGQNLKIPRRCSKERQPLEFSRKNRPSKTTTKASRKLFECFGCGSIPVISPYLLNRPWWWRQCARNGKVPWPKRLNCPPQLGVTWGWWAWWLG